MQGLHCLCCGVVVEDRPCKGGGSGGPLWVGLGHLWGLVGFLGLWALAGRAVGRFAFLVIMSLAIMSHQ